MRLIPVIALTLATLLTACGQQSEAPMQMTVAAAPMLEARSFAGAAADRSEPPPPPPAPPEAEPGSVAAGVAQRVIIRNASLTLVVKDAEAELKPLGEIAARFGGFVSQSGFNRGENGATSGNVQLRVDAARLDEVLAAIRQRAIEVRDLNISSEDVTGQVVDVEARLRNLRSAETQLLAIMQQAKKTEDVMAVFGQLTQTRGEIEQLVGRLKYLRESAALSTVNLTLEADANGRPVEIAGWQPTGTAKRAIENLIGALQGLADLVIWTVIVLGPLMLLVGLPLRWLWQRGRRVRAGRATSKP